MTRALVLEATRRFASAAIVLAGFAFAFVVPDKPFLGPLTVLPEVLISYGMVLQNIFTDHINTIVFGAVGTILIPCVPVRVATPLFFWCALASAFVFWSLHVFCFHECMQYWKRANSNTFMLHDFLNILLTSALLDARPAWLIGGPWVSVTLSPSHRVPIGYAIVFALFTSLTISTAISHFIERDDAGRVVALTLMGDRQFRLNLVLHVIISGTALNVMYRLAIASRNAMKVTRNAWFLVCEVFLDILILSYVSSVWPLILAYEHFCLRIAQAEEVP